MENKLNLPLKKKKNEAESPRLDPLMRALKALHSAGAPETMTEEEMKDFIRAHMARHKVPRYIDFVDGFPMNAAGKIQKFKMREEAVEKLKLQEAAK